MGAQSTTRDRGDATFESFESARDVTFIRPQGRRLTEYEAVTVNSQPDLGQFDSGGWYILRPDGLGTQDSRTTQLHHPDWFEYRDPAQMWQRPYVKLQAKQERSIQGAVESAKANGSLLEIKPEWLGVLSAHYEAFASFEWGVFRSYVFVAREALSDTLSVEAIFNGTDRMRHQQAIALYSLDLDAEVTGYAHGEGMDAWLNHPAWQPARRVVERLLSLHDWGEVMLMSNLVVDPLITSFIGSEFFRRQGPLNGDMVTSVIEMTVEADRLRNLAAAQELVRMLTEETDREGQSVPAAQNKELIQGWVDLWYGEAVAAVDGFLPLFASHAGGVAAEQARERVVRYTQDILEKAGFHVPAEVTL